MIGVNKSTFLYYELVGQTNKIVNTWTKIGLLDGLSKRKSIKCAIYLEECFIHLISTGNNNAERINNFNAMLFPVIRRVITGIRLNIDFNIFSMTQEFFRYYTNNISKFYEVQNMDVEAELCSDFSKCYIKKLNKNN